MFLFSIPVAYMQFYCYEHWKHETSDGISVTLSLPIVPFTTIGISAVIPLIFNGVWYENSRKGRSIINDHKFSTFSSMSATPNEFLSVKKQYQTSFLLWIKTILHFEITISVTAPPFHSFRLTYFCPPWSLLFCKSIHQCL